MNDQSKSLLGSASVDPDKVETVSHVDAMPQAAQDGGLGTQAREGEPVGVVYSLKADLNTAELPDGTLLYTHPAHPSADHAELTRLAEAAGEEALGNLLAVIHGDGGHRALEVGTKQAALEAEKIVAGLFAAPSADKLREFGQHTNLELSYHYSEEGDSDGWQVHRVNGGVNDREWDLIGSGATPADAIDQALAALKAEGC